MNLATRPHVKALTGLLAFALLPFLVLLTSGSPLVADPHTQDEVDAQLSLITDTPDEGFEVALTLARRGVSATQPDRDVLQSLRPEYATDPDALIAASHVVAVHFRTVAEANDFWR